MVILNCPLNSYSVHFCVKETCDPLDMVNGDQVLIQSLTSFVTVMIMAQFTITLFESVSK